MSLLVRKGLLVAAFCVTAVASAGGLARFAENTQPKVDTVPNTDVGRKDGSLSDKLSTTGGVIHPGGEVDPGIEKPPPAAGTMRLIPPPGSPGGAPGVEPK